MALARAIARLRRLLPRSHKAVRQRSRALLLSCLDDSQRREFERTRGFTIRGQSGQRYCIAFGTVANIGVLNERGELLYRLCAGPTGVPVLAAMLAQKLMLETHEAEFLAIAVRHPLTFST